VYQKLKVKHPPDRDSTPTLIGRYDRYIMQSPTTIDELASFVERFDTFVLDLDGTIWHAGHVLPGVRDALQYLRGAGKKLIFLTNNPVSRSQLKGWFRQLEIEHSDVRFERKSATPG
jgi:phosphoglycolate phosphatase-like HAD superfamily hydrolase